jgi:ATP-binding cassette subfamily B protein
VEKSSQIPTAFFKNRFFETLSDQDKINLEQTLSPGCQQVIFRTGEDVIVPGVTPPFIYISLEGKARQLGRGEEIVSLELLDPGSVAGLFSLVSGVDCEWVRASGTLSALKIPADNVLKFITEHPSWYRFIFSKTSISEIHPLICDLLKKRALPLSDAKKIALELLPQAVVLDAFSPEEAKPVKTTIIPSNTFEQSKERDLSPTEATLVPGVVSMEIAPASPAVKDAPESALTRLSSSKERVIGVPSDLLETLLQIITPSEGGMIPSTMTADDPDENAVPHAATESSRLSIGKASPPYYSARNKGEAILACLKMLAGQLDLPFREEVIRAALKFQLEGTIPLTFHRIGTVADMIGIATQPMTLPVKVLKDQDPPFLIMTGGGATVVQAVTHQAVLIADPLALDAASQQKWAEWDTLPPADEEGYQILLCRRSRAPKGEPFGFATFIPYIRKHTRTFIEVIIASLFIQVFALANPMIIQVIIDKVIVQENLSTLNVLGALLIICTLFGAALTAIRTFLFTDATNRIDLALGMKVLEHLYRLPLSYFHERPVGEVASRLRELDKIRNFLTGTALTAILDSIFSVVFVAIMFLYSPLLTVISLLGVPILVALMLFVSPIIRRQIKDRAEKGAAMESHLVESLTGIQTIKGQNIETRSRWRWYKRNGEMIAASFRNTITSTSAGTIGMLINRFNDVAVLWIGIYMIIDQKLSLGQLIAFRMLAGNVTSPLLRLAQSWQSFQEAALSVDRLGDVANRPREDEGSDDQIPMPEIQGRVVCHELDFGYAVGKLQLENVSLEVPAGNLVAMVGLSGSGKSTLLKVIGRLYEPVKGSVEIDGFNISKVELNSLRRQIGMVFQETLLMGGSILDNIAMSNPDAHTSEVIEAAKLAEAHEFIMKLSHGYATPVGEQGRNLSGGQRQRIALARLIMQSPNILLLDEATSALDAPTEQRVITNIQRRYRGKTIFFATHRLSTVKLADQIFYMENGILKETGTHQELMEKKGLYYALSLQQEVAE